MPAVSKYLADISAAAIAIKNAVAAADCTMQEDSISQISALLAQMYTQTNALQKAVDGAHFHEENVQGAAIYYCNEVLPKMNALRDIVDQAEVLIGSDYWPMPTYADLLFKV